MELWKKTTTFSKQRFRRSFFSSGRTTAPYDTGDIRDSTVVLQDWANDCPVQLCPISRGAIDRLVRGERPAIALLLLFCWATLGGRPARFGRTTDDRFAELQFSLFWAVDRPTSANDQRLFCCGVYPCFRKALFSCFFASIFVLLIKSSVHSRNLLKHIKLEEITTIHYGKCNI